MEIVLSYYIKQLVERKMGTLRLVMFLDRYYLFAVPLPCVIKSIDPRVSLKEVLK